MQEGGEEEGGGGGGEALEEEEGRGGRPSGDMTVDAEDAAVGVAHEEGPATPKNRGGGTPAAATAEQGPEGTKGVVVVLGCQQQQQQQQPQPVPFAYSQENFHIADGNLYSILTPRQPKAGAAPAIAAARRPTQPPPHPAEDKPQQRTRGRRRAKWKLKFHHQALPPEYLDHYEAAMAQEARAAAAACAPPPTPPALARLDEGPQAPGPSKGPSTAAPPRAPAKGTARRVPNFIQDLQAKDPTTPAKYKLLKQEGADSTPFSQQQLHPGAGGLQPQIAAPHPDDEERRTSVIMAGGCGTTTGSPLRDLPFMGEMTLDSKPRRGRKPKKADICHLIYKNYGTVLSPPRCGGASGASGGSPTAPSSPSSSASSSSGGPYKSESLLARRLTQSPGGVKRCSEQDEPLNLCIRDLCRINVSGSPVVKAEPEEEYDDDGGGGRRSEVGPPPTPVDLLEPAGASAPPSSAPMDAAAAFSPLAANYIYWPNAGLFVHPMALQSHFLYCNKMGGAAQTTAVSAPAASPAPPRTDKPGPEPHRGAGDARRQLAVAPAPPPLGGVEGFRTPEPAAPPATFARPLQVVEPPAAPPGRKRAVHAASLATKRKRSAIFIPPTADNPTEVSICKFKFTGGAKPSLEEKKMLSVDAGGNFRYYSGTGDKSMRGYEFFPREQQQPSAAGSSAVLAAPSSSSLDLHPSEPQTPAGQAAGGGGHPTRLAAPVACGSSSSSAFHGGDPATLRSDGSPEGQRTILPDGRKGQGPSQGPSAARRKRRTRKSLVREKLEQTFREKGFLIQTQQLESAEGATYCKFRQLRKFTRYLFRSWKDYLPGNIKEISGTGGGAATEETGDASRSGGADSRPPHE